LLLERLEAVNSGALRVEDGQYLSQDGRHAILFLETKHSPFDGAVQAPFLEQVQEAFNRVNHDHGAALSLEQSSLSRYAVASEKIIRQDINRISGVSTLAIALLFLLLFRSARILLLSFVPLLFGIAAGVAASMAWFGEIHGLTLAFGSTLIGVCVDYPLHFLNHHSLIPSPDGPRGTLRRIRWALVLGAGTTLAGFVGLAGTSFPGMRELALFASAGIVAALAATYWLLPPLSAAVPPRVALHQACAEAAGRLLSFGATHRRQLALLPLAALVLCAFGLPRVRWSDDLSGLNRIDEGLRREDERVRSEVSRMDSSRLIVAAAANDAQALAINDRISEAMTEAQSAGELGGFSSLHSLLFSESLQARNAAARLANLPNGKRVIDGFAAMGFRPEAFAGFSRELAGPAPGPLTLIEVLQSPLGDLVRPFRTDLGADRGQRVGLVTLVRDVSNPEAIRRRLAPIEGAYYFDQEEFLARTYGRYRRRTLEVVSLGILVMFGTVFLKYRRWRPTLAAGLPALVASATTLAILGLAGVVTNVLHLVSLLLVLSAGEDYAVFLIESASEPRFLNASAVSIALCCFATVLGFGLLGLSAMPALKAIGMTTGIGVLISLVLAPTALVLLPKVEPAP
jgi:predicted exporter